MRAPIGGRGAGGGSSGHAVVVGGSLAGLCAAASLSRYFDRVTVFERDPLPLASQTRAGVPQAVHVHALLARGRVELERLFPGFGARMRANGALELDLGREFAVLRPHGWAPRRPSGIEMLFASRELLEATVRALLCERANVDFVERVHVLGLRGGRARCHRVSGVVLRDGSAKREREIPADLVVDASGRGSRAPRWLRDIGRSAPPQTRVDSFARYVTRWYETPSDPDELGWQGAWIDPKPPRHTRGALLFPVEGGRWIVTIASLGGAPPPRDERGFCEALEGLRSPIVARAVGRARAVSPLYYSRSTVNRFRHYERWRLPLPGFIAIGDAVCAFNPVYGQGMSVAAAAAGILARELAAGGPESPDLASRFFRAQARFLRGAWRLATSSDFRFAATVGRRSPLARIMDRYLQAAMRAAADDQTAQRTLTEVVHLLRPPGALFAPPFATRVIRGSLRTRSPRDAGLEASAGERSTSEAA